MADLAPEGFLVRHPAVRLRRTSKGFHHGPRSRGDRAHPLAPRTSDWVPATRTAARGPAEPAIRCSSVGGQPSRRPHTHRSSVHATIVARSRVRSVHEYQNKDLRPSQCRVGGRVSRGSARHRHQIDNRSWRNLGSSHLSASPRVRLCSHAASSASRLGRSSGGLITTRCVWQGQA